MGKITKRNKIRIAHVIMYILVSIFIYINIGVIRDFIYDYEILSVLLLVIIFALPAYLHIYVFVRKKK